MLARVVAEEKNRDVPDISNAHTSEDARILLAEHGSGASRLPQLLGLLVFGIGAYFYNGALDNHNSRLNAIWTFVEPGPNQFTWRMDDFMLEPERGFNTVDWSYAGGHYYANKAPGVQFLGSLAYWPIYHLERALGAEPREAPLSYINAYLVNLCVSVLPIALAASLFCRFLLERLGRPREAFLFTLALFAGTMLFPHTTQLWGHTTAAACWFAAMLQASRDRPRNWVWAGAWAGAAVLIEYSSAISVMMIGATLAGRVLWRWRRSSVEVAEDSTSGCQHAWRSLAGFIVGGLPAAVLFLLYHRLTFGHWLVTANHFQNPQFSENKLFLGMFGVPSLEALWGITFSPRRGLFWSSPMLLLALVGFWHWWRKRSEPLLLSLCLALVLGNILANSTFNGWHGGSTFAPRYLIVTLPFLGLGLANLPPSKAWRRLLGALSVVSIVIMLAATCVNPTFVANDSNPVASELASFWKQQYTPYKGLPIRNDWVYLVQDKQPLPNGAADFVAFNLGTQLGLQGHLSLLPLAVFVLILFGLGWRLTSPIPLRESTTEDAAT